MIRRTQQKRSDEKRAQQSLLDGIAEQARGDYRAPDRSECSVKSWYSSLDDADTLRVDYRIWRLSGRLVDFVILLQVAVWDDWENVARVDCCHGHCHLHPPDDERIGGGESRSICRLDAVDDAAGAFDAAVEEIESAGRRLRQKGN